MRTAQDGQQKSLAPAWVKVLCPNAAAPAQPSATTSLPPPLRKATPVATSSPPPSGPPPTATSLLGLPQAWLLRLADASGALDNHHATLMALFRTCTSLRDAVLRHRTAKIAFGVQQYYYDDDKYIRERFSGQLERLCTMARRCSRLHLTFDEHVEKRTSGRVWAEPHITHLLVCAAARLGGERPLACVKELSAKVSRCGGVVWGRAPCVKSMGSREAV